ncbi:MAG: NTP transferase domain-containing protein [Armatimonadetes bacterium]|nr:NTP transferase domain-containing protein [Armatimonadota bacterium]
MMRLPALILAGGDLEESLRAIDPEASCKAFLKLDGKCLVEHVISALRGASSVGKIYLVTKKDAPSFVLSLVDGVGESGTSILKTMEMGIGLLPPDTSLALVCPCDLPFLTGESVDAFVRALDEKPASIYYSFLSRSCSEGRYPEARHTYVRLRGIQYCGGGLIALKPTVLGDCARLFHRATELRKKPLKLAGLLGWGFILKYLLGRLSVAELEARASALLGHPAAGIEMSFPEVGFNIDHSAEFFLAQRLLEGS